jgi:hypothetical protein
MARIRAVEIENFRGIRRFAWRPSEGISCLIGPGDSGKSSILTAIDLCLTARRNIAFTDADFPGLDVETPIRIAVTIGELDDASKSLDSHGMFLRGFSAESGVVEDEPEKDAETVLTVVLSVGADLDPSWTLFSERAAAQNQIRHLSWSDRSRFSPTRIGAMADYNLGWRRGSVLNRLSDESADPTAALTKAAREARAGFGGAANAQLEKTLGIVTKTALELGIPIGKAAQAMLDVHSVSFSGGTISLHDEAGVPLSALGTGSTRLLVAGLQREAAAQSAVILIDEVEHGLEPHRIIRLLGSLGAKEKVPPLQVVMATHSPAAICELSGAQLFVVRKAGNSHECRVVGVDDSLQGTIRRYPEAFLAQAVIVCEGASEVGFLRGIDQHRVSKSAQSIAAMAVAIVDGGGESKLYQRASAFRTLGYRCAVLRDDDTQPSPEDESAFKSGGGKVVAWRDRRALEDELFLSLSESALAQLLDRAIDLHGDVLINEHIKSASNGKHDLSACRAKPTMETRVTLGKASRAKKAGWFKSVTAMEHVARDIVAPDLPTADAGFASLVAEIFAWAANAEG